MTEHEFDYEGDRHKVEVVNGSPLFKLLCRDWKGTYWTEVSEVEPLAFEVLRLAAEVERLKAGERERQIELLCGLIDDTRATGHPTMNTAVRAKLAALRKERGC